VGTLPDTDVSVDHESPCELQSWIRKTRRIRTWAQPTRCLQYATVLASSMDSNASRKRLPLVRPRHRIFTTHKGQFAVTASSD